MERTAFRVSALLIVVLLCATLQVKCQVVVTVAGNGSIASADGTGTFAAFNYPNRLAVVGNDVEPPYPQRTTLRLH